MNDVERILAIIDEEMVLEKQLEMENKYDRRKTLNPIKRLRHKRNLEYLSIHMDALQFLEKTIKQEFNLK